MTKPNLISLFLISILLTSCFGSYYYKQIDTASGKIPADFAKNKNEVLLIQKYLIPESIKGSISGENQINGWLKRIPKKMYSGASIFLDEETEKLSMEKFNNTDVYRFIFKVEYQTSGTSINSGASGTVFYRSYAMYDRKLDKTYNGFQRSTAQASIIIKAYMKRLNEMYIDNHSD